MNKRKTTYRNKRRRKEARQRDHRRSVRKFRENITLNPKATYYLYDEKNKMYVADACKAREDYKISGSLKTNHACVIAFTKNKKYAKEFKYDVIGAEIFNIMYEIKTTGAWKIIKVTKRK